jgi:inosine-uridine nucleoside N-ribohydrolase
MTPRKIVIDTDPGADDMVALLLALASPEDLEVLGVVAVAGNLPLAVTERNARRICALAGRPEVAVHAGCARPLLRPPVTAEDIHGDPRIEAVLPSQAPPLAPQHGVDFLVETVMRHQAGEVTLCTLGPLTDVATALVKAPEIAPRLRELVMMGGAYHAVGNVTPTAEFNVYCDPHAAEIVLRSGIPIVMLPLDATLQVVSTGPRIARFRALGNRCGPAVAEVLSAYRQRRQARFGPRGRALHDPTVIAYLLRPDLFRGRDLNVAVETGSELTIGMTVADWWGTTGRPANVRFIDRVDAAGFYDLLSERVARLP